MLLGLFSVSCWQLHHSLRVWHGQRKCPDRKRWEGAGQTLESSQMNASVLWDRNSGSLPALQVRLSEGACVSKDHFLSNGNSLRMIEAEKEQAWSTLSSSQNWPPRSGNQDQKHVWVPRLLLVSASPALDTKHGHLHHCFWELELPYFCVSLTHNSTFQREYMIGQAESWSHFAGGASTRLFSTSLVGSKWVQVLINRIDRW